MSSAHAFAFEPDTSTVCVRIPAIADRRGPAMPQRTLTLYRPVGPSELDAIAKAGWEAYPSREAAQPFFYPLASEAYAREIAEVWNAPAYGAGYVTRVRVQASFIVAHAQRVVGAGQHEEYWIPQEAVADFNAAIRGRIVVVARYPE